MNQNYLNAFAVCFKGGLKRNKFIFQKRLKRRGGFISKTTFWVHVCKSGTMAGMKRAQRRLGLPHQQLCSHSSPGHESLRHGCSRSPDAPARKQTGEGELDTAMRREGLSPASFLPHSYHDRRWVTAMQREPTPGPP